MWIKKATGLGDMEFFLRFMAWLCLRNNNDYRNSQMCIVTGPNIDIAIKLIKRMKSLFERKLGLTFANKETVLELNGCRIEAYPSNHIDAYRALDNPKFILLDEADFFSYIYSWPALIKVSSIMNSVILLLLCIIFIGLYLWIQFHIETWFLWWRYR